MQPYNNYFPANYQPYQTFNPYQNNAYQQNYQNYQQSAQMQQPVQQMQQAQPQQMQNQAYTLPTIHAEIVQVDDEQAAKNFNVAVGTSQMMIAKDDSAIFKVSYLRDGVYIPYRTILFHRLKSDETGNVTASIVLTAGTWKFEEDTAWSGQKYTLSGVTSNLPLSSNLSAVENGEFTFEIGSTQYGDLDGAKTFNVTIINSSTGNSLPPSAESAVTNKIPKLVVQE